MPITRTYTITDLLSIGRTVDLTHYKSSINDDISDIRYIVSNIYDDYMDEIMSMCVTIKLNDEEYSRYRFRPKLLSHRLYGTTELSFMLCKINNVVSDKDFSFRRLNVLRPDSMEEIYRIYEEEKRYLRTIDVQNVLSIDESYYSEDGRISDALDKLELDADKPMGDLEIGGGGDGGQGGSSMDIEKYNELLQMIKNLQEEINNINLTILEILENLIRDDLDDIINEILDSKIKEKLLDLTIRVENLEDLGGRLPGMIDDGIAELEGRIPGIVGDQVSDMRDQISDILDRLSKLEDGDVQGAGILTRDVVIQMPGPFDLGIQHDTEFRVPYTGNIVSANISVNTSSERISNILTILQMHDSVSGNWYDKKTTTLRPDRMHDLFTINERVDGTYIRLELRAGDLDKVDGITVILTVLEDSVAESLKKKTKE